jgi:hypothetical protein
VKRIIRTPTVEGRITADKKLWLDNSDYEHMFIHNPTVSVAESRNVEDHLIDWRVYKMAQ